MSTPPLPRPPPFRGGRTPPLRFLAAVAAVLVGSHLYLWWRLVHGAAAGPVADVVGGTAVASGAALIVVALGGLLSGRKPPRAATRVGFVWLGLWFVGVVVALSSEPVRWVSSASLGPPVSWLGLIGVAGGCAFGFLRARSPVVTRVNLPIRGLDPALAGFRIVQISDLHVGPTIGRGFVERVVALANAQGADLVALTGDLVDGTPEELESDAAPLAGLRGRHGVFSVTGNHEYYAGAEAWIAQQQAWGWRVLRNERVRVEANGAAFELAGVDDLFGRHLLEGHGLDLDRALAGAGGWPVLLLAHQPAAVHLSAGRVAAQLSGHTHGGQIFPFHLAVRTQQPSLSGLTEVGSTALFVHRGTGYWGPPFRIGAPPEIAVIELVPG